MKVTLGPPERREPDREEAALAQWLLFAQGMKLLPSTPFELHRGVFVSDPESFYAFLDRTLAQGVPGQVRVGLFRDLRKLRELFGG